MSPERVNYNSLKSEYLDPESLQYKKLRLVDQYISKGHSLLDIGSGTGEFIKLEINKFDEIYGVDADPESLKICVDSFKNKKHVHIFESNLQGLDVLFSDTKFDYITCLDVLEHIELIECKKVLQNIHHITTDLGFFIFTGPGIFEKIRISLGMSPTHLHSHSSYGWKKLIEEAGFEVLSVETVEFPLFDDDFLRKKIHIFGKCCTIISQKVPRRYQ
jgi:ubiquinone/menaquinone biosynthesis C-methylase UbiE